MLSITSRIQLDEWSGFEVAGGSVSGGDDSSFSDPELKINIEDSSFDEVLKHAKVVRLTDEDDLIAQEDEFQRKIPQIISGSDPEWKIVSFRVFPNGIRLEAVNKDYDFQLAEIRDLKFRVTINVPVTDDPGSEMEEFRIEISQSFSEDFYAWIHRSGEPNRSYELWYSKTHTVTFPKPTNWFARWVAKMLFPDYYKKNLKCIDHMFDPHEKTYLVVHESTPIRNSV